MARLLSDMLVVVMAVVMEPVEKVRDDYGERLHCFEVLYPSLHELTVFDGGEERRPEEQREQEFFLRVKV
jgi:hypothetical protein